MAIVEADIQAQHHREPGAARPERFRALLLAERAGQEAVVADCEVTIAELTGQTDVDSLLEREMAVVGAERAHAALDEIGAALDELRSGRYGRCTVCGERIPEARLEVIPYARTCVFCPRSDWRPHGPTLTR
jgi:DnaK suppressor protein